jgi:hypothetical protein
MCRSLDVAYTSLRRHIELEMWSRMKERKKEKLA